METNEASWFNKPSTLKNSSVLILFIGALVLVYAFKMVLQKKVAIF
jgi:hypothetical protein